MKIRRSNRGMNDQVSARDSFTPTPPPIELQLEMVMVHVPSSLSRSPSLSLCPSLLLFIFRHIPQVTTSTHLHFASSPTNLCSIVFSFHRKRLTFQRIRWILVLPHCTRASKRSASSSVTPRQAPSSSNKEPSRNECFDPCSVCFAHLSNKIHRCGLQQGIGIPTGELRA